MCESRYSRNVSQTARSITESWWGKRERRSPTGLVTLFYSLTDLRWSSVLSGWPLVNWFVHFSRSALRVRLVRLCKHYLRCNVIALLQYGDTSVGASHDGRVILHVIDSNVNVNGSNSDFKIKQMIEGYVKMVGRRTKRFTCDFAYVALSFGSRRRHSPWTMRRWCDTFPFRSTVCTLVSLRRCSARRRTQCDWMVHWWRCRWLADLQMKV